MAASYYAAALASKRADRAVVGGAGARLLRCNAWLCFPLTLRLCAHTFVVFGNWEHSTCRKSQMSTRKSFKRKAAPHETPPLAVCDCRHVAVAESEQLTSAGGGSLPPPDIRWFTTPR